MVANPIIYRLVPSPSRFESLHLQLLICHDNSRMHEYVLLGNLICARPSLGDDWTKWEKLFIPNLYNPCWACIQVELQFMDRHIQPFNCVTRAGTDPAQCIGQWDVLSLYMLDFSIVFLNPKHHSCNLWRSCCKVFLENCLPQLVVCFDSAAASIYIVVELLKSIYYG